MWSMLNSNKDGEMLRDARGSVVVSTPAWEAGAPGSMHGQGWHVTLEVKTCNSTLGTVYSS